MVNIILTTPAVLPVFRGSSPICLRFDVQRAAESLL